MSDSMQTKYIIQKSIRKPKNDQKICIMQTKNVFFARNNDFFFPNISYKNKSHIVYGLIVYPILFLNNIFP